MRKLIIIDDEGRRTTVPLVRSEITIGRLEGNTIRLTERNVSRSHARIYRDGEDYRIEDTSRYGTRINGLRFDDEPALSEGDVLAIGDYKVEFVVERPAATSADDEATVRLATDDLQTIADASEETGAPPLPVAPSGPASRLICVTEPFVGSEFSLSQSRMTIGTAPDCDLIIEHPSIAPHHAAFVRIADEHRIEPIDAGYPVAVNGRYNPTEPLASGDDILLGELRFRYAEAGEKSAMVPLADVEDELVVGRPSWVLPAILGAAALLLVMLAMIVRGGGPDTPPVADAPEPAPSEAADDGAYADALGQGREHLEAARWDEAVAAVGHIPTSSPAGNEATRIAATAQSENEHSIRYDAAVAAFDAGDNISTLTHLAEIPATSYYATLAAEEEYARRATEALVAERIAASHAAEADDDVAEARRVVTEVVELAGNPESLVARIAELDALDAEAAREAEEEERERDEEERSEREERQARDDDDRDDDRRVAARNDDAPAARDEAPEAEEPPPEESRSSRRERASELRREAARAGVQRNHRQAILLLEEARELNPSDPQISLMLYSNYRSVGNTSRAARAIRDYIRQRPDDSRRGEYEAWLEENAPN